MPEIKPKFLAPLVGYYMWYLQRDKTAEEAHHMATQEKRFAKRTPEQHKKALGRALQNLEALNRWRLAHGHMIRGKRKKWIRGELA